MGGSQRPQAPDPMRTAQVQQGFNKDSLRDAIASSQIGQENPFGEVSYSGEIGSPDRKQTTTLNPQDQQRLNMQRSVSSGLLGLILGGQGGGGMPGNTPGIAGGYPGQPQGNAKGGGGMGSPMPRMRDMQRHEAGRNPDVRPRMMQRDFEA